MKNHWLESYKKKKCWDRFTKKLSNPKHKHLVTTLLDNQFTFNQTIDQNNLRNSIFCRNSLSIISRIYDPEYFPIMDLISFEPLISPCGTFDHYNYRYDRTGAIVLDKETEPVACKIRRLELCHPIVESNSNPLNLMQYYPNSSTYLTEEFTKFINGLLSPMYIANEAEMTFFLANKIRTEITKEIINDLRAHVATIGHCYNTDPDYSTSSKFNDVSDMIRKKTLRNCANWAITSPEIFAHLHSEVPVTNDEELCEQDTSNFKDVYKKTKRWFVSKSLPKNEILMGYHDNDLRGGYFYLPYIPMNLGEVIDSDNYSTLRFMARYAKKLTNQGPKHYAQIIMKGFN